MLIYGHKQILGLQLHRSEWSFPCELWNGWIHLQNGHGGKDCLH